MARILGIGGVSCSGKSTFINKLKEALPKSTKYVCFDDYYIRSCELTTKNSWESPRHYRYEDFVTDLKKLQQSKAKLIVVEGFLIFHSQAARELFDYIIYLDLSEDKMIERRLQRRREGDTVESILADFIAGQRKYVYPQKEYADLIISGELSAQEQIEQIQVLMGR